MTTYLHTDKYPQNLEQSISRAQGELTTLRLTKQGAQAELTDLVRSRTELQCVVSDLQAASDRVGGKREELQGELMIVDSQIAAKETDLEQLKPAWQAHRARESTLR